MFTTRANENECYDTRDYRVLWLWYYLNYTLKKYNKKSTELIAQDAELSASK